MSVDSDDIEKGSEKHLDARNRAPKEYLDSRERIPDDNRLLINSVASENLENWDSRERIPDNNRLLINSVASENLENLDSRERIPDDNRLLINSVASENLENLDSRERIPDDNRLLINSVASENLEKDPKEYLDSRERIPDDNRLLINSVASENLENLDSRERVPDDNRLLINSVASENLENLDSRERVPDDNRLLINSVASENLENLDSRERIPDDNRLLINSVASENLEKDPKEYLDSRERIPEFPINSVASENLEKDPKEYLDGRENSPMLDLNSRETVLRDVSDEIPLICAECTSDDVEEGFKDLDAPRVRKGAFENPMVESSGFLETSDVFYTTAKDALFPTPDVSRVCVDDVTEAYDDSDVRYSYMGVTSDEAEARLWAKRQARAEAREIRMRELERQQREQEENADRQFDMLAGAGQDSPVVGAAAVAVGAALSSVGGGSAVRTPRSAARYMSSRRSSEDSLEDTGSLRELRHELKEVEEKFRKAMIANAQLDNDKTAQTYQIELLNDRLEELEEEHASLKREHRDKCREHEQLKRLCAQLKDELTAAKFELQERDRLIAEKGLVIVEGVEEDGSGEVKRALVTAENAKLLETAGEGSLDVRLAKFAKEKSELQDQISHLKLELEEEKSKRRKPGSIGHLNGPSSDYDYDDLQREASKQLADYKFRAQKAEQDVATLQATVARLESQVIRYKTAAEVSEQSEEALKAEKRKLQREVYNANQQLEALEASNVALSKAHKRLTCRKVTGT
ncbi:unnamed protein product [Acanthoscelides obtectus]|uniref:Leucine-rich repeat flightless-interacting protein 2 n=1 Tax=Acanthoscelides obtectus TaxID=200917 RepID=A0A9P0Q1F4_ACAOB|nr:unnamed protein product [Acanthoscelides obtectus]CAK1644561.1 Leucine-rich repeat flightless-interacting protein 2 [Acanthoscelides obtectus]